MSEKYDAVMEHVVVTAEMRERILRNVRGADLGRRAKVLRFPRFRRYAAIAACLAVLLAGALTAPRLLHSARETPQVDAQGGEAIVECRSAEDLSAQLGFPIADLSSLPFEAASAEYLSWWGETGEIDYTGPDGQTAAYRKSLGTDDNSGIFDTFPATEQLSVGSVSATLKGDETGYTLAVWTDGTYAYSLSLSDGVSAEAWSGILSGVC